MSRPKKSELLPLVSPKGAPDILPKDEKYWERVESVSKNMAREHGFVKIETPIFESSDLYLRSLGEATDVVEKQMFFLKKDGLVLRPEGTAGVVRAYTQNGFFESPQPVKFYYSGSFFRHEQPQAGRLRQFHQFGLETIGASDPIIDMEVINVFFEIFLKLGIKNLVVEVNSMGCRTCRPKYRTALLRYYRPLVKNLCQNCKNRYEVNPLRLLDCKEEICQPAILNAPVMVDKLCEECKKHFQDVLEYLDELVLPYVLNSHLVRGFDYYTKTVFEIFAESITENQQNQQARRLALCAGGRYDNLMQELGGRSMPAVGGALGIERIIEVLKTQKIKINELFEPEVFIVQLGLTTKRKALRLFEDLRKSGFKVAQAFSKDNLDSQLRFADRYKVKITLILGQKEVFDETVIIKEMNTGVQETVSREKLVEKLRERLKNQ
ncbi:histidine--tRNA ligase [Candidatus Azambacteria bacterium]|nr:histidine--tRNA ligase [Candidatus Azambacteria bacterium]